MGVLLDWRNSASLASKHFEQSVWKPGRSHPQSGHRDMFRLPPRPSRNSNTPLSNLPLTTVTVVNRGALIDLQCVMAMFHQPSKQMPHEAIDPARARLASKDKHAGPVLQEPVQAGRCPLRHFVTYGSTNKYMPVRNIRASAATANRPIQLVYLCLSTAQPLKITTSVKAVDSQRCSCRIHLLQFNGASSHRSDT